MIGLDSSLVCYKSTHTPQLPLTRSQKHNLGLPTKPQSAFSPAAASFKAHGSTGRHKYWLDAGGQAVFLERLWEHAL